MKVVRFLERKEVIKFFGLALMLSPFINFFLHSWVIKSQSQTAWSQFQFLPVLKSMNNISLFLAFCSIGIGIAMLSGKQKAWKYTLAFVGVHILIQIANVGNTAWKSPLAWPTFILNTALFFFIFDQLVWKISPAQVPQNQSTTEAFNLKQSNLVSDLSTQNETDLSSKTVINLKSYRKILFSFGSDRPWGELKTLSSEFLSIKKIDLLPANIETQVVQINFSKNVVVDIQYFKQQDDLVFFKPLNMNKEKVTNLNKWLRKIAV